ncbi:MAG: hypothetical protein GX158_02960, partial [Bacteroidales bacterium]|nr:hypothetical protein [Bacteroidales bacterium]
DIINHAREYLEYAVSLDPGKRYGLDYPTGINMQALLDLYRLSVDLQESDLTSITEAMIGSYYERLYGRN